MMPNLISQSSVLLLLLATVFSDPITVGITSPYDFCLMMPPQPGQNVGDTEGTSLSRCFGTVPGSDAVGPMPDGMITSAHMIETQDYVQVSGNMDVTKYNFDPKDGGGQYDSALKGSRPGSMCAGYPAYLEYLEPDQSRYCLRCCKRDDDFCAIHRDTVGCVSGMPGTVFGPGFTKNGTPDTSKAVSSSSSSIAPTASVSVSPASLTPVPSSSNGNSATNSTAKTNAAPMHSGNIVAQCLIVSFITLIAFLI